MALSWPLTGRAEELDYIGLSCGRGGSGIVLSGRAGVGKTRLARAAAEAERARGARVVPLVGTATGQQIPLGAFSAHLSPSADVKAMLAGVAAHLSGALLVVDDAHLLDAHSATLLAQLVLTRAVKAILTIRTGEPVPDAIAALRKDEALPQLDVQTLSRDETTVLVETALGAQLDTSAADRLFELSQGNPLYVRELVDAEHDAGRLVERHGVWRWTGTPRVSPSLAELVGRRIGDQPEHVREVLDILSVAEPLPLATMRMLAADDALELAEIQGLVTVDGRLELRPAHPLFAEVRRAELGVLRARRLRARVLTALAQNADGASDGAHVLRRAMLMLDADMPPDAQLLTEAAEEAALLNDASLVERLARAAVDAGGGFRAQKVLAFFASWAGAMDPDAVEAEFARLEELAQTDAERARAVVVRVSHLAFVRSLPDEAAAALRRSGDLAQRQPIVAALSTMLAAEASDPTAADRARQILADPRADDEAVAMASMALVTRLAPEGGEAELRPVAERGMAAASRAVELSSFGISILATLVHGLCIAGDIGEAEQLASVWRGRLGDTAPGSLFADCFMGEALLRAGRIPDAIRVLREARAGLEPYGDMGGWRYVSLVLLTRALAYGGFVADAQRARADLDRVHFTTLAVYEPERLMSLAAVAAAEGSMSEARAIAMQALAAAEARGQHGHAVLAVQQAAGYGERGLADRAATLAQRAGGPRPPAVQAYASALDARDGRALLEASTAFEALGDLVAAAEAAGAAAQEFDRAGLVGSALEARTSLERLVAACGGIRSPLLRRATQRSPLTEREHEIAVLAAQGLTNQAIADRLVVSVRTVEGHLYRINQKLGITHREDLARILG